MGGEGSSRHCLFVSLEGCLGGQRGPSAAGFASWRNVAASQRVCRLLNSPSRVVVEGEKRAL
jgi:hypothetical protein